MSNPEVSTKEPVVESKSPPEIQERAEDMEIAPHIERATGIKHHPTNMQAQVQDDQGQQLIQTPQNQSVTITLPSDQQQLTHWSKGKITESVTWFALYWLRMAKKAAHNGWKTVIGGDDDAD